MSGDMRILGREEAERIHAVLVALAGARDGPESLHDFVRAATRDRQVEYRFQGRLGFGGKFYWDGHAARVGFYTEDATALREAIRDCANARLARLLGTPRRPSPDPCRLLAACAAAMAETGEALAAREAVLLARRSPERSERPAADVLKAAEARVRASRDALDAAGLRAREAIPTPPGEGA